MNRIDATFQRLREKGEAALIPFITAGDPDLETTRALVLELERRGADLVELGVPFSDPLADGVTIQRASQRALEKGASLAKILHLVGEIRQTSEIPLVLMSYYNPILCLGLERFAEEAKARGLDGLIVPDLPPEEAEELCRLCEKVGVDLIFLLAPTSSPARVQRVIAASRGYIYYVSLKGVTGARDQLPEGLREAVGRIKMKTEKPVAVGFGIGRPEQAGEVARFADGVIVGSAIVAKVEENLGRADLIEQVGDFVATLKGALRGSR